MGRHGVRIVAKSRFQFNTYQQSIRVVRCFFCGSGVAALTLGMAWRLRAPYECGRMPGMDRVAAFKRSLPDLSAAFAAVDAVIAGAIDAGGAVPDVAWRAIAEGRAPADLPDLIRRRGCVVIRGVFNRAQATDWDGAIAAYLAANDAEARARAARPGRWGNGPPQILSVYWSRPQIEARQSPELAAVRAWLNRLWRAGGAFDPDRECCYADRVRRRTPGDATLGLGPHIDGGASGRWLDAAQRATYRAVFAGDPLAFDPFEAAGRAAPGGEDANACTMFRTWQGWTALSAQGPGDGTLRVLPVARAIAWVLLRPLLADVAAESLGGAEAARALWITPALHGPLLRGLVPIPPVEPGDTVWWHPDLIHAVEVRHDGTRPSNVMYIAAAPDCTRNRAYLAPQLAAFRDGRSPPDFPAEDLEIGFAGRAGPDMLSALGRRQMGLD